jgi:tyrosinase
MPATKKSKSASAVAQKREAMKTRPPGRQGGSTGSIPTAPADPIFWMHHANIDRLWWQWQTSPQGQGKNPNLAGAAAVMDPWAYTEPDTRDISTLGYTYV